MESAQRKPVPRLQITLGLLAIVIVALFLSVWIPYRSREAAVAAVIPLNAEVTYAPGGPRWLRLFIGNRNMQAFDYVYSVRFKESKDGEGAKSKVTDADLAVLRKFPYLTELTLVNAPITDEGVKFLSEIPSLTSLILTGTKTSDTGVASIAKLKHLYRLSLANTQVTDAGMPSLLDLKKLVFLSVANTKVGDAGLEPIGRLKFIESLDLTGTQVTDDGILTHLKAAYSIRDASFADTPVTSAGLKELRKHLSGANLIRIRPGVHKSTPSASPTQPQKAPEDPAKKPAETNAKAESSAAPPKASEPVKTSAEPEKK